MLDNDWYVLFTRCGNEEKVKKLVKVFFKEDEIKILIPKRKLNERHKGIKVTVVKTVFPGYVFMNADMNVDMYYKMKNIPNFGKILKAETMPARVPYEEMRIILSMTKESEILGFSKVLFIGGNVKIIEGPLKGLEGFIIDVDKRKNRATLLINILGEPRQTQLGIEQLISVQEDRFFA